MRERDLSAMSKQYSSRDLPSHTKLKTRESGQGTSEEHRRKDFRGELEDRERVALRDRQREKARREGKAVVSNSIKKAHQQYKLLRLNLISICSLGFATPN